MKRLFLWFFLIPVSMCGQVGNIPVNTQFQGVPVGGCQPYSIAENAINGDQYNCLKVGNAYVWTKIASGGGGAISGSGTLGKLTIWSGTSSLGNSNESEVAGVFTIGIPASIGALASTGAAPVPSILTGQMVVTPAGNISRQVIGGNFEVDLAGTHNNTQTMYGVLGKVGNASSGTITAANGLFGQITDASGTITTANAVRASLTVNNATEASLYGAASPGINGTVTNLYGLHLPLISGGTNNWTIRAAGLTELDASSSTGTIVFTGSGLNDMTKSGTYLGYQSCTYTITMGMSSIFTWDDGACGTVGGPTGVTGTAQSLSNGVSVTFPSVTGYTANDTWVFTATAVNPLSIADAAGTTQFTVRNDGKIPLIQLPATTDATHGVITGDGVPVIHFFGFTNTFIGAPWRASGNFTLTGTGNVGVGSNTLAALTTGIGNVAIGANTLYFNTTGSDNIGLGDGPFQSNTTGSSNVGIGGCNNNCTLGLNTTGSGNIAVGSDTGQTNTTGSNNTLLGNLADVGSAALSNATAIGNGAVVSASNAIQLGDGNVTAVSTSGQIYANGGLSVVNSSLNEAVANANPGSTANRAVCLDASANAITCGTTETSGVIGVSVSGAGNTGSVTLCVTGHCASQFDNQSVVGDWAILSTTTAGEFHDTGSAVQTAGVQNFYVQSANAGAGTNANIGVFDPFVLSGGSNSNGGGNSKGTNLQINGSNTKPNANLNTTTPAAQAGYTNAVVQSSNSGNTTSFSVEFPLTTAASNCISGSTTSVKALPIGGFAGGTATGNNLFWSQAQPASNTAAQMAVMVPGCLRYAAVVPSITGAGEYTIWRLGKPVAGATGFFGGSAIPGPMDVVGTSSVDTWSAMPVTKMESFALIGNSASATAPSIAGFTAGWFPNDGVTSITGLYTGTLSITTGQHQYYGFSGSGTANNTTESHSYLVMPTAYTASTLVVSSNLNEPATGTTTFTLDQDSGSGPAASTLVATQGVSKNQGIYYDTTHAPTGAEGDAIDIDIHNNSSGTNGPTYAITMGLNFGAGVGMISAVLDHVPSSGTHYYSFWDNGSHSFTTTETSAESPMPDAVTVSHCYGWISVAGTHGNVTYSLEKNGSTSGTPTVTVSNSTTGKVTFTGSIAYAQGDTSSIQVVAPASNEQRISSISCRTS